MENLTEAVREFRLTLVEVLNSLNKLNATLPTLRNEVDEKVTEALDEAKTVEDRAEKTAHRLTAILLIPMVAILLMLGAVGYASYQNKVTADRIDDCLQSSGQCFQENRKTLAKSIEQINDNTAREIKVSLEENHTDHVETSYLFCKALVNAELPAPKECTGILAQPPTTEK